MIYGGHENNPVLPCGVGLWPARAVLYYKRHLPHCYPPEAFRVGLATNQRGASRREVAVGTIITDRPPHKTVLAQLTHTVPTLEQRSEACGLFALAA
jgi:hypothetical protein